MISQKSQYNYILHQKYFTCKGIFRILIKDNFLLFLLRKIKTCTIRNNAVMNQNVNCGRGGAGFKSLKNKGKFGVTVKRMYPFH